MKEDVKKIIEKVSSNPELKNRFKNAKDVNDILSVAKDAGYSITEDDLKFVVEEFKKDSEVSELSSSELEKVSGGVGCFCAFFGAGEGRNNIGEFGCECVGGGCGNYANGTPNAELDNGTCICAVAGVGATNEKGC